MPITQSRHNMQVHDAASSSDRIVVIDLFREGDGFYRFEARFQGEAVLVAHGTHVATSEHVALDAAKREVTNALNLK
jgi:hypothetical protein